MRSLARVVTIQRAAMVDDGLEQRRSWVNERMVTVVLAPASTNTVTQAALRGQKVTHVARLPAGVTVGTESHRLLIGTTAHRIVNAVTTPRGVSCELEAP